MTHCNLLPTEKDFYERLTGIERRIYLAAPQDIHSLRRLEDYNVNNYLTAALLVNELDRIHRCYNEAINTACFQPNKTTEEQTQYDVFVNTALDAFSFTITIGSISTVESLHNIDECEDLYRYLAEVKMKRFYRMCDNVDNNLLCDALYDNRS